MYVLPEELIPTDLSYSSVLLMTVLNIRNIVAVALAVYGNLIPYTQKLLRKYIFLNFGMDFVLCIGIMKVWDFLPQNNTYILCDI